MTMSLFTSTMQRKGLSKVHYSQYIMTENKLADPANSEQPAAK
jgi:hypothetical protein